MQQRLLRTELILGKEKIEKLSNAKVLIIGLGGVGGYTLEALARSGVRNFTLVDSDRFDETNLNRQLLCTIDTIGKYKTIAAKERLLSIDKGIKIVTKEIFISSENINSIFQTKYDLVVDAIDSLDSKCSLIKYCVNNGIKVVSSMGAGFRTDPTKIKIDDISKTFGDPLAKKVRQQLSKDGITTGVPCVFSSEKPIEHDYKTIASLVTVTGAMGLALAQLAINSLE